MTFFPDHPPGRRGLALLTGLAALFSFSKPGVAADPGKPRSGPAPAVKQAKAPLEVLREAHWLKNLPETITVPVTGEPNVVITKKVADATVDDLAFAAGALSRNARAIQRVASDLQTLHDLAREAGAVGSANAADAAVLTVRGLK
jgi:hypothetical protein